MSSIVRTKHPTPHEVGRNPLDDSLNYDKCLFTEGSLRPVWRGLHLGNRGRRFYSAWITEDPRAVCHGKHFAEHM